MQNSWDDKRYHSLNFFLRNKFGEKVSKISLDGGFSCPNRDGTVGQKGCSFCSDRGSGDFAGDKGLSITEQFNYGKEIMSKKWNTEKYIAYFQAYTNTYAPIDILRRRYDEAIQNQGVVALAIATRPDCLGDNVINLIDEYNKKLYTWVELGLQTINEVTAKRINRGYKLEVFETAVKRLRKKNIDVVVHVIFGLAGETKRDMLDTIKYLSHMDIQGIKLHLLYLIEDTPLVEEYNKGTLKFLEQDEYIDIVCEAIALLPKSVVVHRLTGDAPREKLIGPKWSLQKRKVLNSIDKALIELDLYQGKLYL